MVTLLTDICCRLPPSVRPVRYSLSLVPFIIPDNFSLEGEVDIQVEVLETTTSLTLHIKDLEIWEREVYVTSLDGSLIPVNIVRKGWALKTAAYYYFNSPFVF